MISRENITIVVVDNLELKKHPFGYQTALNIIDHIVWYHVGDKGTMCYKWKYVSSLTCNDITSCETSHALIVKIGTFFNSTLMVMNLMEEASLIGHILDKNTGYYELHDQCYLVKVLDYDVTVNKTHRRVCRSDENFHDQYTPTWIKDGGEEFESTAQKPQGADLISNLLRSGKIVMPFPQTIRNDKSYIYPHDVSSHIQNVRNRPPILFPISTEKTYDIKCENYTNLVGCANALQILLYAHPNLESIHFFDTNIDAINFTKYIIYDWNWRNETYEQAVEKFNTGDNFIHKKEISPDEYFLDHIDKKSDFFETLDNIRNKRIYTSFMHTDMLDVYKILYALKMPNTIIYYSNILSYANTFHAISAIDADLLFCFVLSHMDNDSAFLGMVPFRGSKVYTKKDLQLNTALDLPWRKTLYDTYYKNRIEALQRD